MQGQSPLEPVDYLVVGHLCLDQTPDGPRLGGTAAYASLTACALGLRVGVLTSAPDSFKLLAPLLDAGIQLVRLPAGQPTTFQNDYDADGKRHQTLSGRASPLTYDSIPLAWRHAPIVHLAPVIDEVPAEMAGRFPTALLGVTPQGWLRAWDKTGKVRPRPWERPEETLRRATAAILSIEDVDFDEDLLAQYAGQAYIFVVTRGADGCSVHWNDSWRDFPAPSVPLADPTGAGDIFAAAYLYRLHLTRDPHEAARFAVQIASASITRPALEGIPTPDDIRQASAAAP